MFSFCTNSRLIAKKTNTSAVVIGCRENTQLYKSFDMHFNLDNKEYSLTLENREKKKSKRADCVTPCQQPLFLQQNAIRLLACACLSVEQSDTDLCMTSKRLNAKLENFRYRIIMQFINN